MPAKTGSIVGLLLALLLFAGCAGGEMSRGSARSLYTIADVMEVHREDIGKSIQLKLNQKLFFHLENDPASPGEWTMVDYDQRTLLLLSDSPRVRPGFWGLLLEGRAIGSGEVNLRFTPSGEGKNPQEVKFEFSVRK